MFRLLLWITGLWLFIRTRSSSRMRSQITRNFTISLSTKGGVGRIFEFKNRLATSRAGFDENSIVSLVFSDQWQAVKTFVSKDAPLKLVRGLAQEEILYSGDLPYILWFYELVMAWIPGRDRSVTKKMPDNYVKPDPTSRVGCLIIREPSTNSLDPEWRKASYCREKLIIWSVGRGGAIAGKKENYPHVVFAPLDGIQEEH